MGLKNSYTTAANGYLLAIFDIIRLTHLSETCLVFFLSFEKRIDCFYKFVIIFKI